MKQRLSDHGKLEMDKQMHEYTDRKRRGRIVVIKLAMRMLREQTNYDSGRNTAR